MEYRKVNSKNEALIKKMSSRGAHSHADVLSSINKYDMQELFSHADMNSSVNKDTRNYNDFSESVDSKAGCKSGEVRNFNEKNMIFSKKKPNMNFQKKVTGLYENTVSDIMSHAQNQKNGHISIKNSIQKLNISPYEMKSMANSIPNKLKNQGILQKNKQNDLAENCFFFEVKQKEIQETLDTKLPSNHYMKQNFDMMRNSQDFVTNKLEKITKSQENKIVDFKQILMKKKPVKQKFKIVNSRTSVN